MSLVNDCIVIDADFEGSVKEYASIVDQINRNKKFSQKISTLLKNDNALPKSFYNELIESGLLLKDLSDRQFEPTLNLLFYIFSESLKDSEEVFNYFLKKLLDILVQVCPQTNLIKSNGLKFTNILSTLTNFFNFINKSSTLRFEILKKILQIFEKFNQKEKHEILYLIVPLADSNAYLNYLNDSKTSIDDILKFSYQLSKLLYSASSSSFNSISFNLLKDSLLKNIIYINSNSDNEINQHIDFLLEVSLFDENQIDLSYLGKFTYITNHSVKRLNQNIALLNSYNADSLNDFKTLLSKSPKNTNNDILLYKKQLLTLIQLALYSPSKTLSFKQISNSLNLNFANTDDLIKIQLILIDSIKKNLLFGKIDQLNESFTVYKINCISTGNPSNNLDKKDWIHILHSLNNWKSSIREVKEIVETSQLKKSNLTSNNSKQSVAI
ncbi:uncharacterized protein ASCRUDRAFT_74200 [Ascoidea rubescens DSM 1968]|uniref:PCI domain-containing protein n=1 Tax=Ascoidea rubescens DSM 1968 TaxID=1344418 RepID=A0A1D2VM73_9ASCO|nr:hypothetical protein ASCRUDRAFT_74200 [Ascoidea rubescens DSM 1968]ODV62716.1 hypothetical protein ASCRUDRAFT_74200 [Ascoidea rubescens DSM 1968]